MTKAPKLSKEEVNALADKPYEPRVEETPEEQLYKSANQMEHHNPSSAASLKALDKEAKASLKVIGEEMLSHAKRAARSKGTGFNREA